MKQRYKSGLITLAILAALVFIQSGCMRVSYYNDNPVVPPSDIDQFEVVRAALDSYLSSGSSPVITASELFAILNDGDSSNDPFIISVRSNADYQKGHIAGAINIPWKEIADPDQLAKIPTGKDIVVYCYTGHTAAIAATVLNALGHNAMNLKYGMCAWTTNAEVRATNPFVNAVDSNNYPVNAIIKIPPPTQELNTIDNTDSRDDDEIVRAAAEAYVAGSQPPVISADELFDLLNDEDFSNDPIVISVRTEAQYNNGHIEGAINIPWQGIAEEGSLKRLPPDADIVCYCSSGHTSGIATTALNMLGYNAKNLKWGICSWTEDTNVRAVPCFSSADAHDYPYNTGPNP